MNYVRTDLCENNETYNHSLVGGLQLPNYIRRGRHMSGVQSSRDGLVIEVFCNCITAFVYNDDLRWFVAVAATRT